MLIDDISSTAPTFVRNASENSEIKRTISKVGLTLSRDTRDSILFPSDGSIFTLRKEFAGGIFGGDADYGRLEFQGARFIRTFDPMEQVFSVMGRVGTWVDLMVKMQMFLSLINFLGRPIQSSGMGLPGCGTSIRR